MTNTYLVLDDALKPVKLREGAHMYQAISFNSANISFDVKQGQPDEKDYLLPPEVLLEHAQGGNKSAQFLCGMGYHRGTFGFPVNLGEANKWLALVKDEFGMGPEGAAQGYCYQHQLAGIKERNIDDAKGCYGGSRRLYLPATFLEISIAHDYPYVPGSQKPCSVDTIVSFKKKLAQCAQQGFLPAISLIGTLYVTKDQWFAAEADVQEGLHLLRLATEHGDAPSAFELGQIYRQGLHGVTADVSEAKRYYQLAAKQNHPGGIDALRRMEGAPSMSTQDSEALRERMRVLQEQRKAREPELEEARREALEKNRDLARATAKMQYLQDEKRHHESNIKWLEEQKNQFSGNSSELESLDRKKEKKSKCNIC